jgi:tetratricopeptide (TPR) repeat protein
MNAEISAIYVKGKTLAEQGKLIEAVACYCKAIELNPDSVSVHGSLWQVLCQTKQWDEAVASYRRALEVNPDSSLLYHHLGAALIFLQQWDEAVVFLQRTVELNPNSAGSYRLLGDALSKLGQIEGAIAAYQQSVQFQPDYAEVYWNLAWLMSVQNRWDEAVACYHNACDLQPKLVNIDALKNNFSATVKYTFIRLNCLSPGENLFFEIIGIDLNNIALIQQDNGAWAKVTLIKVFEYTPDQPLSQFGIPDFQRRILDKGYIDSFCPRSGKALNSNQSFYLFYNGHLVIFYRFVGEEEFYLIVIGSWSPFKVGIYFPSRELIISFCTLGWDNLFGVNLEEYVNIFKAHVFCYFEDFKYYILNENSKKLTDVVGFCGNNVGHYFWNEVSAIQELYDHKLNHKLEAFLIGKNNYFDIREIFEEIITENNKILFLDVSEKSGDEIFELCLKNNLFVVRFTGLVITERLASRLYHSSLRKCGVNFLQKVGESKKHFPLLWITLRSHKRIWLSQIEGIANIIKELYKDYRNLGVIFDGFSTEKNIVEKIQNLIPVNIKTYNALDCAIYETILWSHAIDLFITPYGAGLIFPSHIANQPGVVHTHSIWNKPTPYCLHPRENCVPIVPVPSVDSFDSAYNRDLDRNYDVDWRDIYNEVVKIIEKLNEERIVTS